MNYLQKNKTYKYVVYFKTYRIRNDNTLYLKKDIEKIDVDKEDMEEFKSTLDIPFFVKEINLKPLGDNAEYIKDIESDLEYRDEHGIIDLEKYNIRYKLTLASKIDVEHEHIINNFESFTAVSIQSETGREW